MDVEEYTISARPSLNDVDVIGSRGVYGRNACSRSASLRTATLDCSDCYGCYRRYPPLYVVPKSTPTTSRSLAVVVLNGTLLAPTLPLEPGLKVVGMLLPLLGNGVSIFCFPVFFLPLWLWRCWCYDKSRVVVAWGHSVGAQSFENKHGNLIEVQ